VTLPGNDHPYIWFWRKRFPKEEDGFRTVTSGWAVRKRRTYDGRTADSDLVEVSAGVPPPSPGTAVLRDPEMSIPMIAGIPAVPIFSNTGPPDSHTQVIIVGKIKTMR
jgi:hypothetical protein